MNVRNRIIHDDRPKPIATATVDELVSIAANKYVSTKLSRICFYVVMTFFPFFRKLLSSWLLHFFFVRFESSHWNRTRTPRGNISHFEKGFQVHYKLGYKHFPGGGFPIPYFIETEIFTRCPVEIIVLPFLRELTSVATEPNENATFQQIKKLHSIEFL